MVEKYHYPENLAVVAKMWVDLENIETEVESSAYMIALFKMSLAGDIDVQSWSSRDSPE